MDNLLDKFAQLLGAYSQAADDEIQAIEDDDFEAIRDANDDRSEAAKELADFLLEHGPMVTFTDAAPEPTIAPDLYTPMCPRCAVDRQQSNFMKFKGAARQVGTATYYTWQCPTCGASIDEPDTPGIHKPAPTFDPQANYVKHGTEWVRKDAADLELTREEYELMYRVKQHQVTSHPVRYGYVSIAMGEILDNLVTRGLVNVSGDGDEASYSMTTKGNDALDYKRVQGGWDKREEGGGDDDGQQ